MQLAKRGDYPTISSTFLFCLLARHIYIYSYPNLVIFWPAIYTCIHKLNVSVTFHIAET